MSVTVLLGIFNAIKFKHGFLFLVTVPDMLAVLAPSPDDRFHVELPVRPHERRSRFLPHKSCADLESGILVCVIEDPRLHGGIENIDGCILRHRFTKLCKCGEQELVSLFIGKIVIFDLADRTLQSHKVRGIGADQIDLCITEQRFICLRQGGIAADNCVPAEVPDITVFGKDRFLQLRRDIEIVLFGIRAIIKQLRQFLLVKARKGQVKCLCLQCFNFHTQKFLVPSGIHCHAVIGNDIGFLLCLGQMVGKHTRYFFDVLFLGGKYPAVSGDHIKIPVDNDRVDEAEFP